MSCRNCGKPKVNRPRGLCWGCFYCLAIRERYAPLGALGEAGAKGHRDEEPTTEDLDALIAEQMKRLPRWWWSDVAEMERRERGGRGDSRRKRSA